MDSNNDLSEELMRRLSSGGGLGKCRNLTRSGKRSHISAHLWNAYLLKSHAQCVENNLQSIQLTKLINLYLFLLQRK